MEKFYKRKRDRNFVIIENLKKINLIIKKKKITIYRNFFIRLNQNFYSYGKKKIILQKIDIRLKTNTIYKAYYKLVLLKNLSNAKAKFLDTITNLLTNKNLKIGFEKIKMMSRLRRLQSEVLMIRAYQKLKAEPEEHKVVSASNKLALSKFKFIKKKILKIYFGKWRMDHLRGESNTLKSELEEEKGKILDIELTIKKKEHKQKSQCRAVLHVLESLILKKKSISFVRINRYSARKKWLVEEFCTRANSQILQRKKIEPFFRKLLLFCKKENFREEIKNFNELKEENQNLKSIEKMQIENVKKLSKNYENFSKKFIFLKLEEILKTRMKDSFEKIKTDPKYYKRAKLAKIKISLEISKKFSCYTKGIYLKKLVDFSKKESLVKNFITTRNKKNTKIIFFLFRRIIFEQKNFKKKTITSLVRFQVRKTQYVFYSIKVLAVKVNVLKTEISKIKKEKLIKKTILELSNKQSKILSAQASQTQLINSNNEQRKKRLIRELIRSFDERKVSTFFKLLLLKKKSQKGSEIFFALKKFSNLRLSQAWNLIGAFSISKNINNLENKLKNFDIKESEIEKEKKELDQKLKEFMRAEDKIQNKLPKRIEKKKNK